MRVKRRRMNKNVIILTNGLSGSSVLTGLIARAGYWTGEQTFKKKDYDTFENQQLVDLNKKLFTDLGFEEDYEMTFDPAYLCPFAETNGRIDDAPFQKFLEELDSHQPWIWKDPRLWLTIHYWKHLLNLDEVRFVHLTRDPLQTWTSVTIRRQIQTLDYLRRYMHGIRDSIREFIADNDLPCLELNYEQILVQPEASVARINEYLGSELTIDDLRAVYRGDLYRKPRDTMDFLKAGLIYLKNYGQRYR